MPIIDLTSLPLAFDLIGVVVFGLSGGVMAVRKNLDIFGAAVLALCAGLAGGVFRDLIIGRTPPATFEHGGYFLAAITGGWLAFFGAPLLDKLRRPIMVLDALGLGLFAVTGCAAALAASLHPAAAILLGVATAVGGGIVRDLMVREIPSVFKEDIYALAALAGAAIIALADRLGLPFLPAALTAITCVFVIRMLSVKFGWKAPLSPWAEK